MRADAISGIDLTTTDPVGGPQTYSVPLELPANAYPVRFVALAFLPDGHGPLEPCQRRD